MYSRVIKVLVIFSSASVFFISGCGPLDTYDPNDIVQFTENGNYGDILNKDEQGADAPAPAPSRKRARMPAGDQGGPPESAPEGAPAGAPGDDKGGCPVGGEAGGEGGCPSGHCEIPPDADTGRQVQMPDLITRQPVKITPTGEKQLATDVVDYHRTTHVWQPHERHHTVHKHRHLLKRFFPKVVYHPTTRRINRVVTTFSASNQVMPVEEMTAPLIDYGCPGMAQ